MNNEKINEAIAKACGWTNIYDCLRYDSIRIIKGNSPTNWDTEVPDYCNDLNAMHEAEKTLTPQQLVDMQNCLAQFEGILPFHSTAHQRAKAFLQVIGKWEEVSNWEEIGKCEVIGKWEKAQ